MSSKLRTINVILFLILIVQLWSFADSTPAHAQTAPFLRRPYYGGGQNGLPLNAMFDHWCPDYADFNLNDNICSLTPYTINGQFSNGIGRFLKYDGQTPPIVCPSSNCYSGHSGTDINMAYQPVVAAAPGRLQFAGWNNPNHDILLGLMMRIDHSSTVPNHRTVYGHLSMVRYLLNPSLPPEQQQYVGNWQIGTSGTTGNSTGPHLHFEVQFRIGNNWWAKDPYGRPPVDPWQNATGVVSEWLWLPWPDREQTPPTYNGEYTLDNDDNSNFTIACNAGFGAVNCPFWWYVNNSGHWNDLRHTLTNGTTIDYWARWFSPNLPSTAQYEVQVYVPYWHDGNRSRTHAARYEIYHQNGSNVVVVDQHAVSYSTWISLGRYNFTSGTNGYVLVHDAAYISGNHTDPSDFTNARTVIADAVRWRRVN
jgi:murein DD-endopeptidase MepM/ murein hydrolase activator NlpD